MTAVFKVNQEHDGLALLVAVVFSTIIFVLELGLRALARVIRRSYGRLRQGPESQPSSRVPRSASETTVARTAAGADEARQPGTHRNSVG